MMDENDVMRKYAEAHGCPAYGLEGEFVLCGERYKEENGLGVRPLPCVRDEHGDIKEQTVKRLFAKIDEELNELKAAVLCTATQYGYISEQCQKIDIVSAGETETEELAEEAADTITAITSMLEAFGIDAEMRDEAQRRVNSKNRERGRL